MKIFKYILSIFVALLVFTHSNAAEKWDMALAYGAGNFHSANATEFANNVTKKSNSEKNDFCRIVDQYLTILIKLSKKAKPEFNELTIKERIDFQKNYCIQQMKNEKTSMVLLKYFDEKWVNNYIKTVLFDF